MTAGIESPSLLVRPAPSKIEGPNGFLLRLAEANCLATADLARIGVSYDYRCFVDQMLLPEIAVSSDLHEAVQRIGEQWSEKPRIWNRQYSRFCPWCLREGEKWQVGWELLFHDACPKHECWLIDRCSSCGEHLTWRRPNLLRCPCGADLRREWPTLAPREVVMFSELLEARFFQEVIEAYPPFVDLNVDQTQRVVCYLGTHFDPGAGERPLKRLKACSMEVSWRVSSTGAAMCLGWPTEFHRALSALQDRSGTEKIGLSRMFKHAYAYLYRGFSEEVFRPLQAAFEAWLVDEWKRGLGRRNRRLGDLLLDGVRWVPAMAAASNLGISVERLRFLVKQQVIDGVETVSAQGRRFLTVRKDQIEQLRPQVLYEVDLKTATEMLGFSRVRMRGLFRLLFPSLARTLPGEVGAWVISRTEVEELLGMGRHLPVVGIQGEGQVSFAGQLRYHDWSTEEIVELIGSVRRGEIFPVALLDGVPGLPRWIFDCQALAVWRQKRGVADKEWLSIEEVSRRLDTRHEVVLWLVRQGVMKGELLAPSKGSGYRISKARVQEFRDNYLFATEAANEVGVSSGRLRKALAARGVHPVSIDGVGPCRQLFYKRSAELSKSLALLGQSSQDLLEPGPR